jgi:DNA-binding MarR family transcriptional regulator
MSTGAQAGEARGRLFGLLRVAFDQALDDILSRVAPDHPALRPAHVKIFRFGGIDGSHGAELAAHAGITKQSMHEVLTHLEEHGYLVRRPDPDHARVRVVELTETGRALERQVHHAIADVVEAWAARVGDQRLDDVWATLQEITGQPAAPKRPAALRPS